MKYAVFHDYFGAIGGGEKVAIAIARTLGAAIITTDTDSLEKIGAGLDSDKSWEDTKSATAQANLRIRTNSLPVISPRITISSSSAGTGHIMLQKRITRISGTAIPRYGHFMTCMRRSFSGNHFSSGRLLPSGRHFIDAWTSVRSLMSTG